MRRFKLANLVLDPEDFLQEDKDLLYRVRAGSKAAYDAEGGVFTLSGEVDFCTYFNSVSAAKWRKYAHLVSIRLHVETAGDACELHARGLSMKDGDSPVSRPMETRAPFDASGDFKVHELDIPFGEDVVVAGFSVRTEGTVRIRNAYYYTLVDERQVRDIRIALCTTTFHKEEFIVPNMQRIRSGIIEADVPASEGFGMFVVDNGRTLDAKALGDERIRVIPNPNAGGAGGFARGMMAAQDEGSFTHILLMDDDVRMSVESIKRLHALLSLADSEYARSFVNGAMLQLEDPSLQFEDVGRVRPSGGFEKLKPDLRVSREQGFVWNEMIDVEVENAFGAWWFCCIPMGYVEEMGLPMPFFVRCDDIEYGLRCKPTYMTMNGICVWHARFEGRFNGAVACYQYVRNMMVTKTLHPYANDALLMLRYRRLFRIFVRTMDYASAELWLDGLEDYLAGPDVLMESDPFGKMSQALAKAEKLVPIEELDPDVMSRLEVNLDWIQGDYSGHVLRKVAVTIPHDRHWFPDFMLSAKPGMLTPSVSENFVPWTKTAMRRQLVALSPDGKRGCVRSIDRKRYRELMSRYHDLMRRYRNENQAAAQRWLEKMREMTSRSFWERYLGM